MKTMNVPSRSLREHPAQMRTEMDPHELARLVLQVRERGLDPHQPILAADNGAGTYRVVSGHRRWLAALLAEEVRARIDGKEDGVDLDFARQVVFGFAARPVLVDWETGKLVDWGANELTDHLPIYQCTNLPVSRSPLAGSATVRR